MPQQAAASTAALRRAGSTVSKLGNSYSMRAAAEQGDMPFRKGMPRAPSEEEEAVKLPLAGECTKVGTVLKLGVTGLWQPRTVYLTKDVLGIANKDTGTVIDEISLLSILKVANLLAKVQEGTEDFDEHVVVKDEVNCCFDLYCDDALNALAARPGSPAAASPTNAPHSPSAADEGSSWDGIDKNSVRLYSFRTLSKSERIEWEEAVEKSVADAKAAEIAARPPPTCQERLCAVYDSTPCQVLVMTLVMVNFFVSVAEAELVPEPGSALDMRFEVVDNTFTAIFTVELVLNMASHWFWVFVKEKWNWLDFFVVVVSVGSVGTDAGPTVKVIRILRALRVVLSPQLLKLVLSSCPPALSLPLSPSLPPYLALALALALASALSLSRARARALSLSLTLSLFFP